MAVQCDSSDGAGERRPKISIFDFRNCLLLLVLCFLPIVYCGESNISCTSVRSIFESKGMLTAADLQDVPNYDAGELCLNRGCCGSNAKLRLTQHARTQLETSIRSELIKLAEVLSNRAKKFDEFFRKLLQQSREEFHAMFKRTYGVIYEQHSYVFEQLFEQLEQYYVKGDTDLDNMMDNFFGILYQKMFTVLNAQYSFDEKYMKCVSEHMRETQPFEDVPHKLSVQLRRAFVATRTFHKALRAGADVVRNMLQVGITPECVTSWARLRFCGACGDAQPPACSRYCHNLLRGCLPAQADLAQQWDAYVDAVEKVADRLLGPFNIVMVVEPIDIKISEAIMNFQEHNQDISKKIYSVCGKPVLGGGAGPFMTMERTKRSPRSIPNFQNQRSNDDDFEIEASLESLIQEPTMYVNSKQILEAARKMSEQAKDRAKFLQYLRDDIDAEEYEDHERRKREADPEPAGAVDSDYGSYEAFEGKRGKKGKKISTKVDSRKDNVLDWSGPALERLVRETRARVRNSRRYWANLPYLLCSEQSVAPAPNAACFNGSHVASYTLSAAGEGSAALASNPEVRGTVAGLGIVAAQQETLKVLSVKLKDAYNGVDVQWKDEDDQDISPSSMEFDDSVGSGSGSGDGSDDLPEDDDDKEPDYDGSGQAPPDDDDSQSSVEYDNVSENQSPKATDAPQTPYVGKTNIDDSIEHETKSSQYPNIPESPEITEKIPEVDVDITVKPPPKRSSATRPTLQQALIAYTLPVVFTCFGNMLIGLF